MPKSKTTVLSRPCYTLAVENGKNAELTMYGEIVETQPVDWWTGEPIDGQFIVLKDFLADLDTIKDADTLTIHLNSVGGDGYSSLAIHNRLRELKAEITCIVDGVAMSGGSLILCACDHTKAYTNSIILWHHASSYVYGAYNAPSLIKKAQGLETMDKSQAEIYMRKTNKTLDEVMEVMDAEKYLTGREAVEAGLVDELVDIDNEDDVDIAVSSDHRTLFVKGHSMRVAAMGLLPDGLKTIEAAPESGVDTKPPVASGKNEGGIPMTLDELKKSDPEAAAALLAEAQAGVNADAAVQAERQRIADIDAVASLFDTETVKAAKYDKPCTAQEMCYRAAQESAQKGKAFMADAKADTDESGAGKVPAAPAPEDGDKPMSNAEMRAAGKAAAKKAKDKTEEV